jgi:hypothetical protein
MRSLWTFHRRLVLALAVCIVLALSGVLVVAGSRGGHPTASRPPATRPGRRTPSTTTSAPPRQLLRTPTIKPPQTAIQEQIDAELAQAETPASIAAAEETSVAAPAVSGAYPSIPTVDRSDPTAYAIAFATELLDTNYASQSRAALLAWAEHEEGPQHPARRPRRRCRQGPRTLLGRPEPAGRHPVLGALAGTVGGRRQ